jgi:hypothetical protein
LAIAQAMLDLGLDGSSRATILDAYHKAVYSTLQPEAVLDDETREGWRARIALGIFHRDADTNYTEWDDLGDQNKERFLCLADAALEVVAPALASRVEPEGRDSEPNWEDFGFPSEAEKKAYIWGWRDHAAEVARRVESEAEEIPKPKHDPNCPDCRGAGSFEVPYGCMASTTYVCICKPPKTGDGKRNG